MRMGVLYVMAHLIITLSIIIGFIVFRLNGIDDDTFKTSLMVIVGYWFGAMGKDVIKPKPKPKENGRDSNE